MLKLDSISKTYGENRILNSISVDIKKGEIFTIIGSSGQGKTTILRIINLLEKPDSGSIFFDGNSISGKDAAFTLKSQRRMGMLFQQPSVFHDTVFENIAKGLRYRKFPEPEIKHLVREMLEEISLTGYENRKAVTLSGGEKQRVALAAVLVTEPDLLILDEPTSNLDPVSAKKIEDLVIEYNKYRNTTVILATHNLMEAQKISDRMAVMISGNFVQIADPVTLFQRPVSKDVAELIGINNVFTGVILSNSGKTVIKTGTLEVVITPNREIAEILEQTQIYWAVRPEEIRITNEKPEDFEGNYFKAIVRDMKVYGIICLLIVETNRISFAAQVTLHSKNYSNIKSGSEVFISWDYEAVHVMTK